jgi:leader peptidase (prepilin peptidase)/N-methyltransferase
MNLTETLSLMPPLFWQVLVFVFGGCVGSFLNVCIYRIPLEKSVVHPGSACPKCGVPILWRDNLPVIGWLLLRGRSRCCDLPISIRYPLVELLTAGLFLACWITYPPVIAIFSMVFMAFMIALSFIDLDHMIIPDRFSVGGMILAIGAAFAYPMLHGFSGDFWIVDSVRAATTGVIGAFIGSALVMWIAVLAEIALRKEAMGFGDVKLMGAIGAFCGWKGAVFALFGGAIFGSAIVITVFLVRLILPKKAELDVEVSSPADSHTTIDGDPVDSHAVPFGPALAIGAIAYLLYFREMTDAYFAPIIQTLFPG